MSEIVVKKVNLQQDEVDRLNNTIEMKDNTIKYQQEQYLKLLRRLDNRENYGINSLLFTYDELLEILKSNYHPLKNYLERWFGTYNDFKENDNCLYFSEDGIEVEKGNFWLVNRKIYELETMKVDE